jgi:hypothetical protein
MNKEEKLHKVLSEMPTNFTTDQFNKSCRKHGVSEGFISKGYSRAFLLSKCEYSTKRNWIKVINESKQLKIPINQGSSTIVQDLTEEQLKIEELEKRVKELEAIAQPEPLKPEAYQRPKPKIGEVYYYVDSSGEVYYDTWAETKRDLTRWSRGNCYESKEEAQKRADIDLLTQELKDFAEGGEWIEGGGNWRIYCDTELDKFCPCHAEITRELNQIYFKSSERAIEAIRHFGDHLRILFN